MWRGGSFAAIVGSFLGLPSRSWVRAGKFKTRAGQQSRSFRKPDAERVKNPHPEQHFHVRSRTILKPMLDGGQPRIQHEGLELNCVVQQQGCNKPRFLQTDLVKKPAPDREREGDR